MGSDYISSWSLLIFLLYKLPVIRVSVHLLVLSLSLIIYMYMYEILVLHFLYIIHFYVCLI